MVIGVNKYVRNGENDQEVLQIDNSVVLSQQIEQLNRLKGERDDAEVKAVLKKLEYSANLTYNTSHPDDPNNLLRLSIEAAKKRCTLGEISNALEKAWGRHRPNSTIVQGAYSAAFSTASEAVDNNSKAEYESIMKMVQDFEESEGRRPRLLVAKLGQDGHDRGARVIASGFSDIGWDVDVGPLFSTPEEVVMQAIDSDVHVIGISSQAGSHKTLLPALKKELEDKGASNIIVVAGGVIPKQDWDYLLKETQSCQAIFGPGTRIPKAAAEVLSLIPRSSL